MNFNKYLLAGILSLFSFGMISTSEAAMSYEQALSYQAQHADEVFIFNDNVKDAYGYKNVNRFFNLLGKNGVLHKGNTMAGIPDTTFLNLLIYYGFPNIPSEPFFYIRWGAMLAGAPDRGYQPGFMHIAFEDGYIKDLSLQGWEYNQGYVQGVLVNSVSHNYNGRVRLSAADLYELSVHGPIASVSMDDGSGAIKHFFYSGDKDLKNKAKFDAAIRHALAILQIDENSVRQQLDQQKQQQELERKAKMRTEIEAEIKEAEEREAMRKQILAEREAAKK